METPQREVGIGEGERQLVMVRLATLCKRSNLVKLVKLTTENHLGEA